MRRCLALLPLAVLLIVTGCDKDGLFDYLSDPLEPPYANPPPGYFDREITFGFNPPSYSYPKENGERLVIYYTDNPALSFEDREYWNISSYDPWMPVATFIVPRTFRAFCYIDEVTFSEVKTYEYIFRPRPPYTNPSPGSHPEPQSIQLYSEMGYDIYYSYSTDGSDPGTPSALWLNSDYFTLNESTPLLRIRAFARSLNPDWIDSEIFNGVFRYAPY